MYIFSSDFLFWAWVSEPTTRISVWKKKASVKESARSLYISAQVCVGTQTAATFQMIEFFVKWRLYPLSGVIISCQPGPLRKYICDINIDNICDIIFLSCIHLDNMISQHRVNFDFFFGWKMTAICYNIRVWCFWT